MTEQIYLLVYHDFIYKKKERIEPRISDIALAAEEYVETNDKKSIFYLDQLPEMFNQIINEEKNLLHNNAKQAADRQCRDLDMGASNQFQIYFTVLHAEKQQKAFERQLKINNKISPQILPDLSEVDFNEFCEELFAAKVCWGFNIPKKRKGEKEYESMEEYKKKCFDVYKKIYNACKVQPIAAALLPVILIVFSTDDKEFENIYSYLKYKNRRLTGEAQKRVLSLFTSISASIKAREDKRIWKKIWIPLIAWSKIEEDFCNYMELSRRPHKFICI